MSRYPKRINYIKGMRFNNFILINEGVDRFSKNNVKYKTWDCLCDCGTEFNATIKEIKKGRKSCGCLSRQNRYKKIDTYNYFKKIKIGHYKNSALKRGLEFTLSDDFFMELLTSNCVYCGSEPYLLNKRMTHSMYLNGIDRIDSNLGYIEGNVVSCCKICNSAKGDLTLIEFENWINKLIKFKTNENNFY